VGSGVCEGARVVHNSTNTGQNLIGISYLRATSISILNWMRGCWIPTDCATVFTFGRALLTAQAT